MPKIKYFVFVGLFLKAPLRSAKWMKKEGSHMAIKIFNKS
jgi:hypothetical protein